MQVNTHKALEEPPWGSRQATCLVPRGPEFDSGYSRYLDKTLSQGPNAVCET